MLNIMMTCLMLILLTCVNGCRSGNICKDIPMSCENKVRYCEYEYEKSFCDYFIDLTNKIKINCEGIDLDKIIIEQRKLYHTTKLKEERERQEKIREQQKKAEEVLANSKINIPLPKYNKGDATIGVNFDGVVLRFSNKANDFMTIVSVSTYYNNIINTLSNANIELPPEGTDKRGISYQMLLSSNMHDSRQIRRADIPATKKEKTKFGFAIKYRVNGTDKTFYSVAEYNNSDLLSDFR